MDAEIRHKILNKSRTLFFLHGYSKVAMDDIAKELGMSKKTIYKYFGGKNEILVSVFNEFNRRMVAGLDALEASEGTFISKLKRTLTFIGLTLSDVTPIFLEDMQRNSPEIWRLINRLKQEAAFMRFAKLIDRGIEKGKISKEINKGLAVALYASAINNLLDPVFLNELPHIIHDEMPRSPSEIFDKTVNIIFDGMLNEEGKREFEGD